MSSSPVAAPVRSDVTACGWWRPCTVQLIGEVPDGQRALRVFLDRLTASFEDQGHTVLDRSHGEVDLMLMCGHIPDGPQPLRERIPETYPPLSAMLRQRHGLRRNPRHVVAVVEVPEQLSALPHAEVVAAARTAMGRLGAAKVLFVSRGDAPGQVREVTLCTMEGGHPTEVDGIADRVRDRLVTAACARQVAEDYDTVRDAITAEAWEAGGTPERLAAAGRRMGELGLLSPPLRVSDFVSEQLADMYEIYMGVRGFSEGMLFAFDPELDCLVVSASGSWDVDKRALTREQVVAVEPRLADGRRLRVLAPSGVLPMQPSVETWEVCALMESCPTVRVAKDPSGTWVLDPNGEREVPLIRAGVHAHVGVTSSDDAVIETVEPDREEFPYGFGCGTDLTVELARNTVRRSRAVNDPGDPRAYVRWPLLYHGEMAVELWKPGLPSQPFQGLLDLYGTAVRFTPDDVPQPV
ncbi:MULTISPECIES: hypothetical protein [Streptomyces]|uniref:Uncharacterized protein n=2 Tax=Streptomyces TaxID=1883 RepID=A0A100Y7E5_9ACTN|nr:MULTISPECIES: hypothetical protein [Streptomyces]KUH39024.1 hypothetical protein ATE80_09405 [Streptomyces kanasensis]UUS34588.1 hypothetical protein NRO40_29715 [Streptomyces changanensis]